MQNIFLYIAHKIQRDPIQFIHYQLTCDNCIKNFVTSKTFRRRLSLEEIKKKGEIKQQKILSQNIEFQNIVSLIIILIVVSLLVAMEIPVLTHIISILYSYRNQLIDLYFKLVPESNDKYEYRIDLMNSHGLWVNIDNLINSKCCARL